MGVDFPGQPSVYARAFAAATPLWLALVACADAGAPGPTPPSATGSPAPSSSGPRAPLDPAWERAMASGDPLDLATLARLVGPLELAEQLGDATLGRVALAALEHSPDGDQALGPLAAEARRQDADREAILSTLLVVMSRPGALGERLDPERDRRAVEDLRALALDATATRKARSLAVSALRRLADAGLLPHAEIPRDLDQP